MIPLKESTVYVPVSEKNLDFAIYEFDGRDWDKTQNAIRQNGYLFTKEELINIFKDIVDNAYGVDDSSLANVVRKGKLFQQVVESFFPEEKYQDQEL